MFRRGQYRPEMVGAGDAQVVAAIAWDDQGLEIAVAEGTDAPAVTVLRAPTVVEVHEHLLGLRDRYGERLFCVVDSTNGMLDGGLMSSGLIVYRADPSLLGARPVLGSVGARPMADAAARHPNRLTRLSLQTGSLTGRFPEVESAVAAAASGVAALAAAGRSASRLRSNGRPAAALTFDDGPHPPYTEQVLETLARYDVAATFFCVGLHARSYPDLVRRIVDEGHQLANHTWSHPVLGDLDEAQVRTQLDRTDELLDAAGRSGRPLFRPPYGAITPEFVEWLESDPAGRTMVLWDVEAFDWARPGSDAIADRVLAEVSPGSIVLLHDGGGDRSQTVAALPSIVESLLERDYALDTVGALLPAG
jgi:peptidoglycan/xylan/chitin deacetylase (PgdA/CDA1 family)